MRFQTARDATQKGTIPSSVRASRQHKHKYYHHISTPPSRQQTRTKMAAPQPPFKVKAIYAYTSEHDDDLSFPDGTIINVTEVEDEDWYVGEYTAADGSHKSGLFPKNFVEKYEPAMPARPARGARQAKPAEPSAPAAAPEVEREEEEARKSMDEPAPAPASMPAETKAQPPPAPKPEPAVPAAVEPPVKATEAGKKAPPPVAEKSSSFKDRLAAFNKQGAAPVAPFKPGGSSANTFIKKPFVAPPPSRHAYVPPVQKQEPVKVYRREEDPEIEARRREDEEAAEKAGLTAASGGAPQMETASAEGDEDAPKPVSLKERIALLQKQQQEAAAKRAEASTKPKPTRPPKKREQSHEGAEAREIMDQPAEERAARDSIDAPREPAPRKSTSKPPPVPREREVSDGNEADQSAAGETTGEEADHDSSTEDEASAARRQPPPRHPAAPSKEPDVGDEQDETEAPREESEEEEEMDEETRRQLALRERMAKLSGGMGMGAMFGPPGGMAMPGMGGASKPKAKKPVHHDEEEEETPQQTATRAPMVPIPGMGLPGMAMARSMSNESEMTVGKEELDHPITSQRSAEDVPDVEDVKVASPRERAAPPPPPAGMHLIVLPDGPVYCEERLERSGEKRKRRGNVAIAKGLDGEDVENDPRNGSPGNARAKSKHKRYSSSEDYGVTRKPLSPLATPQLRFTRALRENCFTEHTVFSRLLGSSC